MNVERLWRIAARESECPSEVVRDLERRGLARVWNTLFMCAKCRRPSGVSGDWNVCVKCTAKRNTGGS